MSLASGLIIVGVVAGIILLVTIKDVMSESQLSFYNEIHTQSGPQASMCLRVFRYWESGKYGSCWDQVGLRLHWVGSLSVQNSNNYFDYSEG